MNVYQLANQFKRDQLRRERAAATEMTRVYGQLWNRLNQRILDLTRQYYAAQQTGTEVSRNWLYQMGRLQDLRAQVERELLEYARFASTSIQAQQWQAIQAGRDHARSLLMAAFKEPHAFNILPVEALTNLIGFTQEGTPLWEVLAKYGGEAAQAMADRLVQGLALGQNPTVIARLIRQDMGMGLWNSLRLARTEVLRAYRTAQYSTYRENADIIEGWVWLSARNERTCAACWALDGQFFPLDEEFNDHICGRCTPVPKIKGMDLPQREMGVEAFDMLNDAQKLKILGPSKYAAHQAGDLTLPDLVGKKHSDVWGTSIYEKSMKEMGMNAGEWLKEYRNQLTS